MKYFDKHFFIALMHDVINWTLNVTCMAFLWSMSKAFCITIVGLFLARFGADWLYRKSMYAEQVKARDLLLSQFNNMKPSELAEDELEQMYVEDDGETPKPDNKKVTH
jgi:hypothetical protein